MTAREFQDPVPFEVDLEQIKYRDNGIKEREKILLKNLRDPRLREIMRKQQPSLVAVWESIQEQGMVNPLICYLRTNEPGFYTLEIGMQRLAAIKALGWTQCMIVIAEGKGHLRHLRNWYTQFRYDRNKRAYVQE